MRMTFYINNQYNKEDTNTNIEPISTKRTSIINHHHNQKVQGYDYYSINNNFFGSNQLMKSTNLDHLENYYKNVENKGFNYTEKAKANNINYNDHLFIPNKNIILDPINHININSKESSQFISKESNQQRVNQIQHAQSNSDKSMSNTLELKPKYTKIKLAALNHYQYFNKLFNKITKLRKENSQLSLKRFLNDFIVQGDKMKEALEQSFEHGFKEGTDVNENYQSNENNENNSTKIKLPAKHNTSSSCTSVFSLNNCNKHNSINNKQLISSQNKRYFNTGLIDSIKNILQTNSKSEAHNNLYDNTLKKSHIKEIKHEKEFFDKNLGNVIVLIFTLTSILVEKLLKTKRACFDNIVKYSNKLKDKVNEDSLHIHSKIQTNVKDKTKQKIFVLNNGKLKNTKIVEKTPNDNNILQSKNLLVTTLKSYSDLIQSNLKNILCNEFKKLKHIHEKIIIIQRKVKDFVHCKLDKLAIIRNKRILKARCVLESFFKKKNLRKKQILLIQSKYRQQ